MALAAETFSGHPDAGHVGAGGGEHAEPGHRRDRLGHLAPAQTEADGALGGGEPFAGCAVAGAPQARVVPLRALGRAQLGEEVLPCGVEVGHGCGLLGFLFGRVLGEVQVKSHSGHSGD